VAVSPYVVDYSGTFDFARAPEDVWEAIGHIERFEGWWWWLGQLRLEGPGLAPGAVLQGLVSPPVPYRMRVRVQLEACEEPTSIDATVGGDLVGPATLRLSPRDGGTRVDVAWSLEMMQRPMRLAARVAKPLLQWGHDRVVEATVSALASDLGYMGGGGRHTP
jgi:carbon monoxide dehydrogenase subunit G